MTMLRPWDKLQQEKAVVGSISSLMHQPRKHYTILNYYTNQNSEAAGPGKRKLNVRSE